MQTRVLGFDRLDSLMMETKWNITQASYQSELKQVSTRMKHLTSLEVYESLNVFE